MADRRLKEAAYAGNVALLHRLLEEAHLLLQRHDAAAPLHIAASLGHLEFVREILTINPLLSRCRNGDGLSALHLASANGHLAVVKELLSSAYATELCLLRDDKGFIPVHTAAAQGRADVLRELLDAPLEYSKTRALTSHGESILHLSVTSNSYVTVQYLLEREDVDDELLNLKDEKGNTVLHLAVAGRHFQIAKLLLGQKGIQVNAVNMRNYTALDVLLDPPSQHGDLLLGELLKAAGGRTAKVEGIVAEPSVPRRSGVRRAAQFIKRVVKKSKKPEEGSPVIVENYKNEPGTLMVVATLIATLTFQNALSRPGGFEQDDDNKMAETPNAVAPYESSYLYSSYLPRRTEGKAVLSTELQLFLILDMIGLFASLSIILLLICCTPKKGPVMGMLKWILWLAVFSTALAFSTAVHQTYDKSYAAYLEGGWFLILAIFMAWVSFRVMRWLLSKCGCWKKKAMAGGEDPGGPNKVFAVISKIAAAVLTVVFFMIFVCLNEGAVFGFRYPDNVLKIN